MYASMLCAALLSILLTASSGKSIPKVVDLSYPYNNKTYYWPVTSKAVGFNFTTLFKGETSGGRWYQAKEFCSREHGGTHIDAPTHFSEKGWSVDQIPVERMFNVPAVIIDIREKAARSVDATVDPDDVTKWEESNGEVPQGSVVIMYSGWGKHWGNVTAYIGNPEDDSARFHFPGFSIEAAQILLKRGVYGLGVDTPSIDPGTSTTFPVHVQLNKENIYFLENVAYLDQLDLSSKYRLYLFPIKLEGGSGGPTRILAQVSSASYAVASAGLPAVLCMFNSIISSRRF